MKLEWDELWAAMDAAPSTWHETSDDMFYYMFDEGLPLATGLGAFLVGEPAYTTKGGENVYACFRAAYGAFMARYMTLAEFKEFIA